MTNRLSWRHFAAYFATLADLPARLPQKLQRVRQAPQSKQHNYGNDYLLALMEISKFNRPQYD